MTRYRRQSARSEEDRFIADIFTKGEHENAKGPEGWAWPVAILIIALTAWGIWRSLQ